MSTDISVKDLMDMAHAIQAGLDPLVRELPHRLELIEDEAWTSLRAQSFDPETEPAPLWCIDHDQSLYRCEANDLTGCRVGVPDPDQTPAKGDTTGEAALRDNGKRAAFDGVRRELRAIGLAVGRLQNMTAPPETIDGAVLSIPGREAAIENAKAAGGGCDPCAGVGTWTKPQTEGPTDVGGRLDEKQLLCRFHYNFVVNNGRLPDDDEEAQHQSGRRVTVRVNPKQHKGIGEQFARLERGIVEGSLG